MLKAVSKMITPPFDKLEVMCTRVEDARVILDEIIKSLENPTQNLCPSVGTWSYTSTEPQTQCLKEKTGEKPVLETKPKLETRPTVETHGDEWMITVDENMGLVIVDFPMDGLVELDGKKMEYREAKGCKFKKARIL
jgi:hypothetical protein